MEDVEEPVIDIDSSDLKDPLAVVEYIDDIIAYCRETEASLFAIETHKLYNCWLMFK